MRGQAMDEIHLSRLIEEDIRTIYKEAHFNVLQKVIFDLLLADVTVDEDNIELLCISRNRYYEVKREVYDKLIRLEGKLGIKLT